MRDLGSRGQAQSGLGGTGKGGGMGKGGKQEQPLEAFNG